MNDAVVAVIIKDGLILSINRRNNRKLYGLIGGRVEDNEELEQALIREVKEESGLDVKACVKFFERVEPKHNESGQDFRCHCFYVSEWSGDLVSSEEGDLAWLTQEELTSKDKGAFATYNALAFEELLKFIVN
jgi:8-oxo-dGTP diphosphatase